MLCKSHKFKLTKIYNRSIIKKLKKGKNRTGTKLPKSEKGKNRTDTKLPKGEEKKWTTKK